MAPISCSTHTHAHMHPLTKTVVSLSPAPGHRLPSEDRLMLCAAPSGEPASAARGEQTDTGFRTSGQDGGRFVSTKKNKTEQQFVSPPLGCLSH